MMRKIHYKPLEELFNLLLSHYLLNLISYIEFYIWEIYFLNIIYKDLRSKRIVK